MQAFEIILYSHIHTACKLEIGNYILFIYFFDGILKYFCFLSLTNASIVLLSVCNISRGNATLWILYFITQNWLESDQRFSKVSCTIRWMSFPVQTCFKTEILWLYIPQAAISLQAGHTTARGYDQKHWQQRAINTVNYPVFEVT